MLDDVPSIADLEPIRARVETEPDRRGLSIDVSPTATFLTIKSVLPAMKARRRGVIVTMSSFSNVKGGA